MPKESGPHDGSRFLHRLRDESTPSRPAATGPLAGLRVCDLSTVLAGPYCTMLLADLGADVIKVEPPEGDATRRWGPPWAWPGGVERPGGAASDAPQGPPAGGAGAPDPAPESAYFLAINRNKRGIRLDLGREAGREVLRRMLARSDVLVENYRVGGLDRLGFPDHELARANPALVHLAISGFGPDGPFADRPGYDFIVQAMAGLMSFTGQRDEDGGEPTKVGVAVVDLATGMLAAVAILAALLRRERASEGDAAGQRIDISLFESSIAWLANQAGNYLVGGQVPGRMGNEHPNITPYETFATGDGTIAVAVGSERQWLAFCRAIGLPDLAVDERFATNGLRVEHRRALRPILAGIFSSRSTADWAGRLEAAQVPAGPINDLEAVFASPQVEARRMIETVEHATLGPIRMTGIPFKLSATPGNVRLPPPLLGEHTDEVLAEVGFGSADVVLLRADGIV